MYAMTVLIPFFLAIDAVAAVPIGAILGALMILCLPPAKEYDYAGFFFSLCVNFVASVCVQHIFGGGYFQELYAAGVMAVCRDLWGPSHPSTYVISATMVVHKLLIDEPRLCLFDLVIVACTHLLPTVQILSQAYTCLSPLFPFLLSVPLRLLARIFRLLYGIFRAPVLAYRAAGLFLKGVGRYFAPPKMVDAGTQTESPPEPPKLTFSEITVVADIPPTVAEEPRKPSWAQKRREFWLQSSIKPFFDSVQDDCSCEGKVSSREFLRGKWAASKVIDKSFYI